MSDKDVGIYKNPFLLPEKEEKKEKLEHKHKKRKLSPKEIKRRKLVRYTVAIPIILFIVSGLIYGLAVLIPEPECGNAVCENGETPETCPFDCEKAELSQRNVYSELFPDEGGDVVASGNVSSPQIPYGGPTEPEEPDWTWEYTCNDGFDEDEDGLTDCDDPDCQNSDFCLNNTLYVYTLNITSPVETNPLFIEPGENITVTFTFTKDLEPISSGIAVLDIRVGDQKCNLTSNAYFSPSEEEWTLRCTTPSTLMGPQHLFLQAEYIDDMKTRVDYEFYGIIFPTSSLIYNVDMLDPSAAYKISKGKSFNTSCSAVTNNADGITLSFEYNSSSFSWKEIETSGSFDLGIDSPNPESNIANNTEYAHSISTHLSGIYNIRCTASNGSYSISSEPVKINITEDLVPPSSVSNLVSAIGITWIYYNWDAATDDEAVIKYLLYKEDENIANTTNLYYNLTSLEPNKTYNFSVKAYDLGRNLGPSSSIQNKTLEDTVPPTAVLNLDSQNVGADWIYLTWTEASDNVAVDKYIIHKDEENIANTTNIYYNITGLNPEQYYYLEVQAVDTFGNAGELEGINVSTIS